MGDAHLEILNVYKTRGRVTGPPSTHPGLRACEEIARERLVGP